MKKRKSGFLKSVIISLILSVILSGTVMLVSSEVFALRNDGDDTEVYITLDGDKTEDAAEALGNGGLVTFPFLYTVYSRMRGDEGGYSPGEYVLNRSMSYDEMRAAMKPGRKSRKQIKVTIPEGYTVDDIIKLFVSLGIGSAEGFESTINTYDFGYSFIPAEKKENAKYRLEGYLFPDTYYVYGDSAEHEVIEKLLAAYGERMNTVKMTSSPPDGYTADDILIIASFIQREAYYVSDMPAMASVFYNRLKSSMSLDSDASVVYALESDGAGEFSADSLDYASAYNTYKNRGLPPGAICNPGLAAIEAAFNPETSKYYYFVTGNDKRAVFSRTYAEHMRAIAKIKQNTQ